MSTNKQALKENALAATAGSWVRESGEGWEAICCDDDQGNAGFIIAEFQGKDAAVNRKFVESANPATVLALLDELEAAEKRIAELTGKPAEEYADDGELLFEIDFCDDLSTSIHTAQWLKELRIRRAAGISVKGE